MASSSSLDVQIAVAVTKLESLQERADERHADLLRRLEQLHEELAPLASRVSRLEAAKAKVAGMAAAISAGVPVAVWAVQKLLGHGDAP